MRVFHFRFIGSIYAALSRMMFYVTLSMLFNLIKYIFFHFKLKACPTFFIKEMNNERQETYIQVFIPCMFEVNIPDIEIVCHWEL